MRDEEVTSEMGDDYAEANTIPALDFAIKLMLEHPSTECLKHIRMLRALRSAAAEAFAERRERKLDAAVESAMEDDEEIADKFNRVDRRVGRIAEQFGIPKGMVEGFVVQEIEDRMKAAGVDPDALKERFKTLVLAGDLEGIKALSRETSAKLAAHDKEDRA